MFGLGIPELMVIAVIAVIIFGPKRLPEMGRSLGSALREFKKGAESITGEMKDITDLGDIGKDLKEINVEMAETGKALSVKDLKESKQETAETSKAVTGEDLKASDQEIAETDKAATESVQNPPADTAEKSAEEEPEPAEAVKST